MRRKTLLNALSAGFGEIGKAELSALLSGCGIDPAVRGERLDIAAFARIANGLNARLERSAS